MRVLAISGSLRRDSHNTELLRAAAELMPPSAELELFDGLRLVEPYDEDYDSDPPPWGARNLREAIASADAVLFATPEYNSSIPGQLKNAVDWASRPRGDAALLNKPVAVIGASTGMFGAVWAQAELRKVLGSAGARVIDGELPLAAVHEAYDDNGRLVVDDHEGVLRTILADLIAAVREREQALPTAA
jgi:chromate reductase, NAD(P)H dehydrogenase (quinone)